MSEKNEPVCWMPTGKPPAPGELYDYNGGVWAVRPLHKNDIDYTYVTGYRRLPPGWTAEAVRRIEHLYADRCESGPPQAEILAALFPPPEPEPAPWMREAARTWSETIKTLVTDTQEQYAEKLAAHIAKHAGGAK